MAVQSGLCRIWSETRRPVFSQRCSDDVNIEYEPHLHKVSLWVFDQVYTQTGLFISCEPGVLAPKQNSIDPPVYSLRNLATMNMEALVDRGLKLFTYRMVSLICAISSVFSHFVIFHLLMILSIS